MEYPLDGGQILTLSGDIRETACEVLFNQDNEETSIATLILDSILKVKHVTLKAEIFPTLDLKTFKINSVLHLHDMTKVFLSP